MILQLGTVLGGLFQNVVTPLFQAALPVAQQFGQQFLQRELGRRQVRAQRDLLKAQAVSALNTPGISVARVGGTIQPVGGRVQRSTFTPAAQTPAQSPFGNVPLTPFPVTAAALTGPSIVPFQRAPMPLAPFLEPTRAAMPPQLPAIPGALPPVPVGQVMPGAPRFATDQFGRTILFTPSPRPGEGFLPVAQARALNLRPTRPFWRFNRALGQFEKMKPRRMNPFNFKAAARAGRRIERTLEAVKSVVTIARKMDKGVSAGGGKIVKFKTKNRRRKKA